jgi:integrase
MNTVERKNLTALAVKNLKPRLTRYEVRDPSCPGLYVCVQTSGHRSWVLRFRDKAGRPCKLTLGVLDISGVEMVDAPIVGQPLSLQAARVLAASIHRRRAFGDDVVADLKRKKTERPADTFRSAVADYLEQHVRAKTRGAKRTERVFGLGIKNGLIDLWGDRGIGTITSGDLYQLVEDCRRRGVPGLAAKADVSESRARRLFAVLSAFFGWCHKHRRVETNPSLGLHRPSAGRARDRVLNANEIRQFWIGCDSVGQPFGDCFRMLLLTGGRLLEIGRMSWDEVSDEGVWILPSERSKNHRAHVTPLSSAMQEILSRQDRRGPFVFSATGSTPLAGWSKAKARLDRLMGNVKPFVLHDLRRSAASHMGELNIRPDVIELCLNHRSGLRGGIAGVYNRSELMNERRAALQMWSDHVECLVSARDNVIIIGRDRRSA